MDVHAPLQSQAPNARHALIVALLLTTIGLTHRAIQLSLVWPVLSEIISMNWWLYEVMQLLPRSLLASDPWRGILFLQQSPPLPNLLFALLLKLPDPLTVGAATLFIQGVIGTATAVSLALLMMRFKQPAWLSLILGVVFLLWGDLLLIEYVGLGYFFHETLAMLLCCLACHAALDTLQQQTLRAALMLGLCIAMLALTRATFSYFWIVILPWLVVAGVRGPLRLAAAVLVPIILLHGGWALKNLLVHDYFSVSTSTWGGANIRHGEMRRGDDRFDRWLAAHKPVCESPWHELTLPQTPANPFMPDWTQEPALPAPVLAADQHLAQSRGLYINLDSTATRLWSQCLQREFLHFWLEHPALLIDGAWRSYQNFWLPIRQFNATQFFPLKVNSVAYADGDFHFFAMMRNSFLERAEAYRALKWNILSGPVQDSHFVAATIKVLPVAGSLVSALSGLLFHMLPLLLALQWLTGQRRLNAGHGFCLLLIGYVAALTSVVEFSENMRFRLAVEPLLWVMAAVSAVQWTQLLRHLLQPARWQRLTSKAG